MRRFIYLSFIVFILVFGINQINHPQAFDEWYRAGLFQWIRSLYGLTFYYLPFALIYLVLPMAMVYVIFIIKKSRNQFKNGNKKWSLLTFFGGMSWFYTLFYLLWGFNYNATDLTTKLNINEVQPDSTLLIREINAIMPMLIASRNAISLDTAALPLSTRPPNLMTEIYTKQRQILASWSIPAHSKINVRPLAPGGSLLVWSTAGIYLPFSLEGHYDTGLSHLQSAFVIAHELGHVYGITDEAECNFIALLTCLHSKDPYLQYTGMLTYWRYLMTELRNVAPYSFYYLAYDRPLGLRHDIAEIYRQQDRYPEFFPALRDLFYDSYLKANGVEEGLSSYARVINLYLGWKEKNDIHIQ